MSIKYTVIGIMSGTSLDGLDIACCEFTRGKKWQYKIFCAETSKYPARWKRRLDQAFRMNEKSLRKLDAEYGAFIGREVVRFVKKYKVRSQFIASHGHTVFHRPDKGITLQIGSGKAIAAITGLTVVNDFRTGDVGLGGQGAPLAPMADRLLFSGYGACLNLGGFANISYEKKGRRIAFDICPVNIVLNELAGKMGKEFDRDGVMASKGKLNTSLLNALNALDFYRLGSPKSLGREWLEKKFIPVLDMFKIPVADKLRTVSEHAAFQIGNILTRIPGGSKGGCLVTGGGAYNKFLVKRISQHAGRKIALPDDRMIQFKEALAFAFLGLLRMRNEINTLSSVTGAKRNSSGGKINLP